MPERYGSPEPGTDNSCHLDIIVVITDTFDMAYINLLIMISINNHRKWRAMPSAGYVTEKVTACAVNCVLVCIT